MGDAYLGEFEHLVLLAVMRLGDDAYGVPIRRVISERAARDVSFGAVYSTLRRLHNKGYLEFREEPAGGAPGGRPRRIAVPTGAGEAAVRAAQQRLSRMSEGLLESVGVGHSAARRATPPEARSEPRGQLRSEAGSERESQPRSEPQSQTRREPGNEPESPPRRGLRRPGGRFRRVDLGGRDRRR